MFSNILRRNVHSCDTFWRKRVLGNIRRNVNTSEHFLERREVVDQGRTPLLCCNWGSSSITATCRDAMCDFRANLHISTLESDYVSNGMKY